MSENNSGNIFTADFKETPYWWEDAPRPLPPEMPFPDKADVVIIGSGYTGLCAAIQTVRAGRHTVVLDAEDAGWGCSSRNGGQVSTSFKPDFEELTKRHGADKAQAVLQEGKTALDWIGDFVAQESINCDYRIVGRFHGAHTPGRYNYLARVADKLPEWMETGAHMVPRKDQPAEIDSDFYHGGIVYPKHASLHPARYHQGLYEIALREGVQVFSHCRVNAIEGNANNSSFELDTARGKITGRDVVVATSGYTGSLTPWQRRRVIPIGTYMITTEDLGEALPKKLLPTNRVLTDTRRLVVYYRQSPDGRRILFGGRVSLNETNTRLSAPKLHEEMVKIFPQLKTTKITHSWMGFVGWTFQKMPHLGKHNGIYFAMGYCGSGVSLASYFGTRLGQQVVGLPEGRTALDGLPFRTRPLYTGKPWFLSASVGWYKLRDKLDR